MQMTSSVIPLEIRSSINDRLQDPQHSIIYIKHLFKFCIEITADYLCKKNALPSNYFEGLSPYVQTVYDEIMMNFYLNYNGSLPYSSNTYASLASMYKEHSSHYKEINVVSDKEDPYVYSNFLNQKYCSIKKSHPDIFNMLSRYGFTYTVDGASSEKYFVSKLFSKEIIYFLESDPLHRKTDDYCSIANSIIRNSTYPTLSQYLLERKTSTYMHLLFMQDCISILCEYLTTEKTIPSSCNADIYNSFESTGLADFLGQTSYCLFFSSPSLRLFMYDELKNERYDNSNIYKLYYALPFLCSVFRYAINSLYQALNAQGKDLIHNIESEILSAPITIDYEAMINEIKAMKIFTKDDVHNPLEKLVKSKKKQLFAGINKLVDDNCSMASTRLFTYRKETMRIPEDLFYADLYKPIDFFSIINISKKAYHDKLHETILNDILKYTKDRFSK